MTMATRNISDLRESPRITSGSPEGEEEKREKKQATLMTSSETISFLRDIISGGNESLTESFQRDAISEETRECFECVR
jgi:hypothetical protein